jgi:hypothetical protein
VLAQLRSSLTYANVMASVAVFVALGGTSYAVATGSIDSREIKNNTVSSKDIRNNGVSTLDLKNNSARGGDVLNDSLTGDDVLESSLGTVPNATNATNATNAINATNATNATNAVNAANATNATNAGNANTLGGLTAAQLQQPIAYGDWENNALVAGSTKNVNSVRDDGNGIYCIDVSFTPKVAVASADPGDFRIANASAVPSGCEAGEDISVYTFSTGNTLSDSDFNFVAFG